MNSREIYLDNNATTRVLPEVVNAVARAMRDGYGNPSSVHGAGSRARAQLWGGPRAGCGLRVRSARRNPVYQVVPPKRITW